MKLSRFIPYKWRYKWREYRRDRNDLRIKHTLYSILQERNILHAVGITRIQVKTRKYIIYVKITLTRPGLFIGRQGIIIDDIKAQLMKDCEKTVQIELEGFDPFN